MRKINIFWNWFQDNNQAIKNLKNETPINKKQICYWLDKQLGYYSKDLDFMIVFPKKQNQKTELIITANGNPDYFNQVEELINNAPVLKHWKFTAFIQPTSNIDQIINGLDEPYVFQEITIKTSEIKFLPLNYDDNIKKLDIIIYLKNYTINCNTKTWQQIIYIILQDVLGEKSLYQNINFVQLAQLSNSTEELIELYELQFYIDTINKSDVS
ncbi:hypothetical protein DI487_12900 [Flavobacterium sediminis]|uniref:Uncharacterized protein n=1 Tax=Flavobacterium sediminis TaxID=2201181 RepID=A0A2U8QXX2_9FLAO|nr:hypothetical protein [Flavobacterium sediminis]AWM14665.1 hypothetical protein DI487_12900 [Flavobacterium sediminis]